MEIVLSCVITLLMVGFLLSCLLLYKAIKVLEKNEQLLVEVVNSQAQSAMLVNDAREIIEFKKNKIGLGEDENYEV